MLATIGVLITAGVASLAAHYALDSDWFTALLIGAVKDDGLLLTVTAATVRPIQLRFTAMPDASGLRDAILKAIPESLYHDDLHGKPAWRQQMTLRLAEEIRAELSVVRP